MKVGTARIWNLNAKGKRGNIVQAFPGISMKFHLNFSSNLRLRSNQSDYYFRRIYSLPGSSFLIYVTRKWTGCDTNPAGNAGAGADQTDRHNIVQIESLDDNFPASATFLGNANNAILFPNPQTRYYINRVVTWVECSWDFSTKRIA